MKRNTIVLFVVLFILATFAWAGWANFEYRKEANEKMLAAAAMQGELVADPATGTLQYNSPLKGKPARWGEVGYMCHQQEWIAFRRL